MAQLDRLPVLTPALILEATRLEVFRHQSGMLECEAHSVGPMRRTLGPAPAEIDALSLSPEELARDGARVILMGLCHVCPLLGCRMKTWGMD